MKHTNESIRNLIEKYAKSNDYDKLELSELIKNADVSKVTDMSKLFYYDKFDFSYDDNDAQTLINFNLNISNWDVSNVTNMSSMFKECEKFNQSLNNWDVSNVVDMNSMFEGCDSFNGDISSWNVSKVTNMASLFWACNRFDQDISNWNVSSVTNMASMFNYAYKFNQDISFWNISSLNLNYIMFVDTDDFEYSLENWKILNPNIVNEILDLKDSYKPSKEDVSEYLESITNRYANEIKFNDSKPIKFKLLKEYKAIKDSLEKHYPNLTIEKELTV